MAALCLGIDAPALAEPAAERVAAAEFRRGAAEYEQGNFEKALAHFLASLELSRRSSTILNIAQCHRKLKQPRSALKHYRLYLSEFARESGGVPSPHEQEVKEHIERLDAELATEARDRPPPAKRPKETTQPPRSAMAPEVEGRTSIQQPRPAQPIRRRRLWTFITGGAAVVAAGIALGVGLSARADHDEFLSTTSGARYDELKPRVESKGIAATVLWAAAGGLAVTSVVLFFVEGRAEKPAAAAEPSRHTVLLPMTGTAWGLSLDHAF